MRADRVMVPLAMLALIGAGSLILQRWAAETFLAAVVLSLIWGLAVGLAFLIHGWRHRPLLAPTIAALAVGALLGGVAFWYFSVRDVVVDEEIVVASAVAEPMPKSKPESVGPVALARGRFHGEDGHDGTGVATLVETPGGKRLLTFSSFDVSPGPDVDVYLTPSTTEIEDRVELGDLRGNVGNQQYEVPSSVDLRRYDSVILYCVSFTVRIAAASMADA